MTAPTYRFHCRRVEKDISGYYVVRWDRETPITVVASTQDEAVKMVRDLSPALRAGWAWAIRVDRVEPNCCCPKGEDS